MQNPYSVTGGISEGAADSKPVREPAMSRWQFTKPVALMIALCAIFAVLITISIGRPIWFSIVVLVATLIGPFWAVIAFSSSPFALPFTLLVSGILLVYLIQPSKRTFVISVIGALIWSLSGVLLFLAAQAY